MARPARAKTSPMASYEFMHAVIMPASEPFVYYYAAHPSNKTVLWDAPVKEYLGYLYVHGYFYRKTEVHRLLKPAQGLHQYQLLGIIQGNTPDPSNPNNHETQHNTYGVDIEALTMARWQFDSNICLSGYITPNNPTYHLLTVERDKDIAVRFKALKAENEGGVGERRPWADSSERRPVHKLMQDLADEFGLSLHTVRRVLEVYGLVPKAQDTQGKPLHRMAAQERWFRDTYLVLEKEARCYYTAGAGCRVAGVTPPDPQKNFKVDVAGLMGWDGKSEPQVPWVCAVTGVRFDEESMGVGGQRLWGRQRGMWDIVIGRLDANLPAHRDNLRFMSRIARSVIEEDQLSQMRLEPWRRLNVPRADWEAAVNAVIRALHSRA